MRGSYSRLKLFKACHRAYYFRYVEDLLPVQKSEALETGIRYHELLEELYRTGKIDEGCNREIAMAKAYQKYIYPQFKVIAVEDSREQIADRHTIFGRIDGIAEDNAIVEHKTTSLNLDEYEYNLQWDEQMLVYMWLTGLNHVWYTIIRKPTIRQKQNESDEDFYNRMIEWYDTDTENKIRLLRLERTDEQIQDCIKELCWTMDDIENLDDDNFRKWSKNTCYCNHWGKRCEYASICLDYNPDNQYVEFVKGENDNGITEIS